MLNGKGNSQNFDRVSGGVPVRVGFYKRAQRVFRVPKRSTNKKVIFFDSFGRAPYDRDFPQHYRELVKKFNEVEYSRTQIQGFNASTCGLFCVHCIYVLSLGLDLNNFINDYYNDFKRNDKVVHDIVNSIV